MISTNCLAHLPQQHRFPCPCAAFAGDGCNSKCQAKAIDDDDVKEGQSSDARTTEQQSNKGMIVVVVVVVVVMNRQK